MTRWLTVDPGEDTGWAVWEDSELIEAGTEKLWPFADWVWEQQYNAHNRFDRFVVEDFRIYPWEAKSLSWDPVRTARLIGALTFIARVDGGVEFVLQPAKIKEAAEGAGAAELFLKPLEPNRHANDAIRHGIYYLLTNSAPAEKGAG